MKHFKIIARHKWVAGTLITESHSIGTDNLILRFTATIDGWRNWKIYEGKPYPDLSEDVFLKVKEIQNKIREGNENIWKVKNKCGVFP